MPAGLVHSHHLHSGSEECRPILPGTTSGVQNPSMEWDPPQGPLDEILVRRVDRFPVLVVGRTVQRVESLHAERPTLSQKNETLPLFTHRPSMAAVPGSESRERQPISIGVRVSTRC